MSATALGMIIFAYLCGSVSSAILVCRIARLPDPREHGSGNPGATNVLRIGGRLAAAAVLVFDILKGMLPVWLAYKLEIPPLYLGLTAIAACLGISIRYSSISAEVKAWRRPLAPSRRSVGILPA